MNDRTKNIITSLLISGDKRTVQNVDQVVELVIGRPELLRDLLAGYSRDDEPLNMRLSDALQKIFVRCPELIRPYTNDIFEIFKNYGQKEVRWHMAQILPALLENPQQIKKATDIWKRDFETSRSSIVRTFSLQAVNDTSMRYSQYAALRDQMIAYTLRSGTPAMRSRAALLRRNKQ